MFPNVSVSFHSVLFFRYGICIRAWDPAAYSYLVMSIGPSCAISHASLSPELELLSHIVIFTSLGGFLFLLF